MLFRVLTSVGLVALLAACDGTAKLPSVASDTVSAPASVAQPVAAAESASDHHHETKTHASTEADVEPARYEAGKHYRVLSRPIPTANPSKIEVAEFFWYGCSHCYAFEPSISAFKASAPDYIDVVPVPTMWRPNMEVHAKAYYAMQSLNKPELHSVLFDALRKNPRGLTDEKAVAMLFSEHGVEFEKAMKMLTSFGMNSQIRKAKSLAQGARISGTPTLVVNGKYVVETGMAGSQANMLKIASYLAEKEKKND